MKLRGGKKIIRENAQVWGGELKWENPDDKKKKNIYLKKLQKEKGMKGGPGTCSNLRGKKKKLKRKQLLADKVYGKSGKKGVGGVGGTAYRRGDLLRGLRDRPPQLGGGPGLEI